jgi:hypothetical protein
MSDDFHEVFVKAGWGFPKDCSDVSSKFCSDCFEDFGIRYEATALGSDPQGPCPRCRSPRGRRLDAGDIQQLLYEYFETGSRPGRHWPPVIKRGTAGDGALGLSEPAQKDYELLRDLTGCQLMLNAPNLITMGDSSLRLTIETRLGVHDWAELGDQQTLEEALDPILSHPIEYVVHPGTILQRGRINPEEPTSPAEYDSPPVDKVKANRLNSSCEQVWYGAFDAETCIFELKPPLEDVVNETIYIGTFAATQKLNLFDVINRPFDMDMHVDGSGAIHYFLRSLFFPLDRDYKVTQELATRIRNLGFDGILYPSAFSYIRQAQAYPNVMLFGAPERLGTLGFISADKFCFRNVSYNFSYGPALVRQR